MLDVYQTYKVRPYLSDFEIPVFRGHVQRSVVVAVRAEEQILGAIIFEQNLQ